MLCLSKVKPLARGLFGSASQLAVDIFRQPSSRTGCFICRFGRLYWVTSLCTGCLGSLHCKRLLAVEAPPNSGLTLFLYSAGGPAIFVSRQDSNLSYVKGSKDAHFMNQTVGGYATGAPASGVQRSGAAASAADMEAAGTLCLGQKPYRRLLCITSLAWLQWLLQAAFLNRRHTSIQITRLW